MTRTAADFLESCVRGRLNLVVSGGTGSGKTTLLNVLSSLSRRASASITIEDAAELRLRAAARPAPGEPAAEPRG